jgi:GT2 family glycosyltransferase
VSRPKSAPGGRAKVDVVIPFFNQHRLLLRCLKSLELAACRDLEVVLVDDGSAPEESARVDDFCGRLSLPIRRVRHAENRGYKESIHTGLLACDNPYVILLNSDTLLTPGFADRLVDVLLAQDEVRAVAPVSNHPTDLYQYRAYLDLPAAAEDGAFYRAIAERTAQASRQAAGRLTLAPYLTAMCLALDREVFDRVGYFGANYRYGYFEDLALCCAIRQLGFQLAIREDCFVYHQGQGTFSSKQRSERIEIIRHNFAEFTAAWGHLPEYPDLLRRMDLAGRACPV